MQCRIAIRSGLTRTSLMSKRTMRRRSSIDARSAPSRSLARKLSSVSARPEPALPRVCYGDGHVLAAHPSTLVSVFCVPPTFNPAIDAAADLPGPGAVALPDMVQLLP